MAKFTWDHIHLRTPDPEATAQWFEKMLGAEISRTMQQGAPRIDMKIGGATQLSGLCAQVLALRSYAARPSCSPAPE